MTQEGYAHFNPYVIVSGLLDMHTCPPKGTQYGKRVVRWYEFELMNTVDEGYMITDGDKQTIHIGDLFIRKPGMVVQGVSAYGCNYIIFDSVYDTSFVQEYEQPFYQNATEDFLNHIDKRDNHFQLLEQLPSRIKIHDLDYFKRLFNTCLDHYIRQKKDFQFYAKAILYNMLYTIHKEMKKSVNSLSTHYSLEHKYKGIFHAKQFMDQHFHRKIELKELAQIAGYNPDFFCRQFKKIVGKSPIDYLIQIRLFHAKKMLMTTNNPIFDIAWSCGFKNETYFYTLFKKNEQMTPGKYRAYNQHLF